MISDGQIKRLATQSGAMLTTHATFAGEQGYAMAHEEMRALCRAVYALGRDAGVEELERLRKEDEIKAVANQALLDEVERLRVELANAQAQSEAVERDAARYRWLRGDSCAVHSVRWTQWEVRCWRAPFWTGDLRHVDLDEEIDDSMRKEGDDAAR